MKNETQAIMENIDRFDIMNENIIIQQETTKRADVNMINVGNIFLRIFILLPYNWCLTAKRISGICALLFCFYNGKHTILHGKEIWAVADL